ncbi:MAG: hypothetical protein M3Z46_02355 [Actinomycetota bacterium]|nr:hypothetical protein [Actinomycetota bacterium]
MSAATIDQEARVTLLRRALVALGLAGTIAAALRIRGSGGTPPQRGGWRELTPNDLH